MEDVGTRLDKAAKLGGFRSRRQMAQELGINYRTMVNWVERNKITEKGALTISSKIPISQRYLLTGEGEAQQATPSAVTQEESTDTAQRHAIKAEVLSVRPGAGRGDELEAVDLFETGERILIDRSLLKTSPKGRLKALQVDGYSMVPMLFPDSWVVVDETKEFRGDGLYVINFDNTLMVKLLEANLSTGSLWVKSVNPDYESWEIKPGDQRVFEIYGKVVRCII